MSDELDKNYLWEIHQKCQKEYFKASAIMVKSSAWKDYINMYEEVERMEDENYADITIEKAKEERDRLQDILHETDDYKSYNKAIKRHIKAWTNYSGRSTF
jgi:hypothetical protein